MNRRKQPVPPVTAATFTNVRERPYVHLWFDPSIRWPNLSSGKACRLCGVIRMASNRNSGCRGVTHVTLRTDGTDLRRSER